MRQRYLALGWQWLWDSVEILRDLRIAPQLDFYDRVQRSARRSITIDGRRFRCAELTPVIVSPVWFVLLPSKEWRTGLTDESLTMFLDSSPPRSPFVLWAMC